MSAKLVKFPGFEQRLQGEFFRTKYPGGGKKARAAFDDELRRAYRNQFEELRYDFLILCGTRGGTFEEFVAWLKQPAQRDRVMILLACSDGESS